MASSASTCSISDGTFQTRKASAIFISIGPSSHVDARGSSRRSGAVAEWHNAARSAQEPPITKTVFRRMGSMGQSSIPRFLCAVQLGRKGPFCFSESEAYFAKRATFSLQTRKIKYGPI